MATAGVTVPVFEARMREVDAQFDAVDARFDAVNTRFDAVNARFDSLEAKFDSKLDFVRADIKAEMKSGQLQNLLWLSGILLASNGAVIALLVRATKLF